MAVRHTDSPEGATTVARAGLRRISEGGQASSIDLRRVPFERLRLTRPQPVYLLGLDDLRAGRGLQNAHLNGWRYLVDDAGSDSGQSPLALADTVLRLEGDHVFSQLNYGPFVTGTAVALRIAETMAIDAQIRVLHVPALYLVALWLFQNNYDGPLIPIAPAPAGIEANRVYEAKSLLALLTETARRLPPLDQSDATGS